MERTSTIWKPGANQKHYTFNEMNETIEHFEFFFLQLPNVMRLFIFGALFAISCMMNESNKSIEIEISAFMFHK